jgi:hypothetical protein
MGIHSIAVLVFFVEEEAFHRQSLQDLVRIGPAVVECQHQGLPWASFLIDQLFGRPCPLVSFCLP